MENPFNQNDVSRIAQSSVFKGAFTSGGDIRVDGAFEGRLHSDGRLVAGENAVVSGEVVCGNVDFGGTMPRGTFWVKETLSLRGSCSVEGDLHFRRIQIDLDARLNGNCRMLAEGEFEQVAGQAPQNPEKDGRQ